MPDLDDMPALETTEPTFADAARVPPTRPREMEGPYPAAVVDDIVAAALAASQATGRSGAPYTRTGPSESQPYRSRPPHADHCFFAAAPAQPRDQRHRQDGVFSVENAKRQFNTDPLLPWVAAPRERVGNADERGGDHTEAFEHADGGFD